MAIKNAKHLQIKAQFNIGTDEYTSHIAAAEYVPSTQSTSIVDIGGTTHQFGGTASHVLNATIFQDWTPDGLSTYLHAHEGETAEVTLTFPNQASFTSTITLVAPPIGGAGNAVPSNQLSFPSSRPVQSDLTPVGP